MYLEGCFFLGNREKIIEVSTDQKSVGAAIHLKKKKNSNSTLNSNSKFRKQFK